MLPMGRGPYTASRMQPSRPAVVPTGLPVAALWACASIAAAGGCGTAVAPSFSDPTPEARIGAIAASRGGDDLPRIVENLSSDDAAVRMAAIGMLRRRTGETLGYRFDDPWPDRQAAIERWKSAVTRGAGTT